MIQQPAWLLELKCPPWAHIPWFVEGIPGIVCTSHWFDPLVCTSVYSTYTIITGFCCNDYFRFFLCNSPLCRATRHKEKGIAVRIISLVQLNILMCSSKSIIQQCQLRLATLLLRGVLQTIPVYSWLELSSCAIPCQRGLYMTEKHIEAHCGNFHRYNHKACQKLSKIAPVKVTVTRVFSTNWVSISMGFKGSSLLSSDEQNSSHLHDQNASKPKKEFLGDEVPTTTHNKCNYATNVISGGGGSFKSDQSLRQQGRWKERVVSLTSIGRKSLEFSFFTSIYVSGWLTMFKSLIYKFELHDCIIITDYVVMMQ